MFTIVYTPWNDRLRDKRNDDGLTQPALGERLGVTQNRISDMEAGSWPSRSPEVQQALADYLGEPLSDLRREVNGRATPADEGLDDLRDLVRELRESNAAILEALGETLNRLTEIAGSLDKLGRKRS